MFSKNLLVVSLVAKRAFSASSCNGEKTALYDVHVKNGGKIVSFGGFLLPIQYGDLGISASHVHTRQNASLFDVSHMLQTEITGKQCVEYFESICTADLSALQNNTATLTVFTNENGGIYDDLIVTKISDEHLFVVSNGATRDQNQKIMLQALDRFNKRHNSKININFYKCNERGLVALQGPKSQEVLKQLSDIDLSQLYFMNSTKATLANVADCRISRCGYTGEDGFEISIPANHQVKLVETLLQNSNVKLAGLGARDSLRLEAGLCLYGNDINQKTTPVEAALTWLISKARRQRGDFPGSEIILDQIKNGSKIKRVGIVLSKGPPARQGAVILDKDETQIGEVTSGCPGPSLGKNVAMGYVPSDKSKTGTQLLLKIRDKIYEGVVTKMPFVKSNYYNKPK